MFASCRCHTTQPEHQFGRRHRTTAARAAQEKRLRLEPLEVRCLLSVSYGGGTSSSSQTQSAGVYAPALVGRPAVSQQPTVTSICPGVGLAEGWATVTIDGSGLTGATAVKFGNTPAQAFTVVSDGQITATSPQGLGTVDVTVITPGGTSATSTADQFTYQMHPNVTGLADRLDTKYDPASLTLRDAVALTNSNAGSSFNDITFDQSLSGTIYLSLGELAITDSVEINGNPTITIDAGGKWRIFDVDNGDDTNASTVSIEDLTLTGGSADNGGAISSTEDLTLVEVTVTGNTASQDGGGIYNRGTINLDRSAVSRNTAGKDGGGLFSTGGDATNVSVNGGSLSGNTAAGSGGGLYVDSTGPMGMGCSTVSNNRTTDGGGLFYANSSGWVGIDFNTFSGNTATGSGGGLWLGPAVPSGAGPTMFFQQNTVAGNTASESGGGIYADGADGTITIENSTITGNTANTSADGTGKGGGIYSFGTMDLSSTIVAQNTDDRLAAPDLYGPVNNFTCSLVGDNTGSGLTEAPVSAPDGNGNLIGGPLSGVIDAKLGPLADNGGLIETCVLAVDSPAIDAGSNPGLSFDQRGNGYPRIWRIPGPTWEPMKGGRLPPPR